LSEFGGTIGGEETSGRIVIIPNSLLFEQNVINYTSQNDYILDEVIFTITYSSDIDRAKEIAIKTAEKVTQDFLKKTSLSPFIRANFQASGVDVRVRYYTIASRRQEIQSDITEEIFKEIMKEKKVEFAFPHVQVVH
jgi:small-conductance mechanosensitive channel